MDAAAIAIPVPVQPIEPPPATPGKETPAEGKDGAVDFARTLEQQITQAPTAAAKPVVLKLTADDSEPQTATETAREDTRDPAAADGLLAMMAAPLLPQTMQAAAPATAPSATAGEPQPAVAGAHMRHREPAEHLPAGEQRTAPHAPAPLEASAAADPQRPAHASEREAAPAPLPFVSDLPAAPPAAPPVATPHAAPAPAPYANAQTAARAEPQIAARVGSAEWSDGLAQQVTVMVKDGEHTARLRLDPPDLGPLEVRLSMARNDDGVAHAQFVSPHAAVRDALEAALPQLRAVLADNGITLGQASVGEGFAQQQPREPQRFAGRHAGERGNDTIDAVAASRASVRHGLVDTFA